MAISDSDIFKMSYPFFADRPITSSSLNEFLDFVASAIRSSGKDRDYFYSELERRHTVSIPERASILEDNSNHVDWFNPSTNSGLNRDVKWQFWANYKEYLVVGKNWPSMVVEGLDRESSTLLSKLEDPYREGPWDVRGMVMGAVQAGKTANYTALIAKAIDSGYKLIIILAGVHNSLRSQTQFRLNEEILGYDFDKVQEFDQHAARIGVRKQFRDHPIAQTLTSSSEHGDFKKRIAEQAGVIPSAEGPPTILVVKKHVSILKNLLDWSTAILGIPMEDGTKLVTAVPLLLIDDECDYASVNTRKVEDEFGNVDPERDPAKTNLRIRQLLNSFSRSNYVGYTATPFANIFIHHDRDHPIHGPDLFPRNFILSLPKATNYIGPAEVFGIAENSLAGIEAKGKSNLVRIVKDSQIKIPDRHKKDLVVDELPASMVESIKIFLLSCAIRRIRKTSVSHTSMLIHVTRFTDVQKQIKQLVESELQYSLDRIRSNSDELEDFKDLWESDMKPGIASLKEHIGERIPGWDEVIANLYPVAKRIVVRLINGTSNDALSYRKKEAEIKVKRGNGIEVSWEESGEHVIAIGGDKLSRGLTLDGLSVSYYLRASRMFDTLLQMGRWFGYRDQYLDVCRIYTSSDLASWYRFIASASFELQQELEYMSLTNRKPSDFPLKVREHPGQLAITSAGKRRWAETLDLSYSGRISETVVFSPRHLSENRAAVLNLVARLDIESNIGVSDHGHMWKNVDPEIVLSFFDQYKTHQVAARIVDPDKISRFIRDQLRLTREDLKEWSVLLVNMKETSGYHSFKLAGKTLTSRVRNASFQDEDKISIGRLVDPVHESADLTDDEQKETQKLWKLHRAKKGYSDPPKASDQPGGMLIRASRSKRRGFLIIYPISSDADASEIYGREKGKEVFGFAVSFPASNTTHQVAYKVNSVFQEDDQ